MSEPRLYIAFQTQMSMTLREVVSSCAHGGSDRSTPRTHGEIRCVSSKRELCIPEGISALCAVKPILGAGSMYSTVRDLLRQDQGLYTERLVSRKSLEQIFTPFQGPYREPHPIERGLYSPHKYGYGWFITKWFERNLVWHPGLINGFCSAILRYPDDRTLVVVLENLLPDLEGVSAPPT